MKRVLSLFMIFSLLIAQPKHEFRAAWVATVLQLDWPSSYTVASQKSQLISILDGLEKANVNAVIFQVRPACDAFWDSDIEPWSNWLTGTEGKAPNPYYDPLQFAIEEAHKRNIELHAWFNPYRAQKGSKTGTSAKHVTQKHPEWILAVGTDGMSGLKSMDYVGIEGEQALDKSTMTIDYILNPGLQEVRDYVLSVIMEVVNKYDIDGVHMDDYFYPYGGMNNEDQQTFNDYNRGISDIHDWRRDNINLLLKSINDSINTVKPYVKFGMSPFGIWKSGVPSGIVGLDAYSTIYCDAVTWLQSNYIDYITPQLYWPIGGGQDYKKLMRWWAEKARNNNRVLYTGNAPYRINANSWAKDQLPRQIKLNRNTEGCEGNVYFRAKDGFLDNPKGFLDSLKTNYYHYKALTPKMTWKDSIAPNAPQNLRYRLENNQYIISWDKSTMASDGDTAYKFVVYKDIFYPVDTSNPVNIVDIIDGSIDSIVVDDISDGYFAVTAVDRMSNESGPVDAGSVGIDNEKFAEEFQLLQNYPNPFNPSTTIPFIINKNINVSLKIYNMLGQEVATLIDNEMTSVGKHNANFDAHELSTGIYFYQIKVGELEHTRKMVLIK